MKRFKSVNRAIKRGHLEVKFESRPTGRVSPINGQMEMRQIPYLVRVLERAFSRKDNAMKTVKSVFYSYI